jgi:hypothetical protein
VHPPGPMGVGAAALPAGKAQAAAVVVFRRAARARPASTAIVAASSAAATAIRAICQPGMPPVTAVRTGAGGDRPGERRGQYGRRLDHPGLRWQHGRLLEQPGRCRRRHGQGEGGWRGGGEGQQGTGQPGQGGAETADAADGVHEVPPFWFARKTPSGRTGPRSQEQGPALS